MYNVFTFNFWYKINNYVEYRRNFDKQVNNFVCFR